MSSSRCSTRRRRCPALLAAMPAGYRPIVVDNGSTDGSGRLAATLGAPWSFTNRGVASAPPAGPACVAAGAGRRRRVLHGRRRLARSRPTCRWSPVPSSPGRGRPRARRPPTDRRRGLAGPRPAGQRRAGPGAATPHRRRACATSGPCGPPAATACSPSICGTGASAGRWRWCCARPTPGGGSPRSPSPTDPGSGDPR